MKLNKLNSEEAKKHSIKWILFGAGVDQYNLTVSIWKNNHKKYNNPTLNRVGFLIKILYFPTMIILLLSTITFLIYTKLL